jgi:hypothetical protein
MRCAKSSTFSQRFLLRFAVVAIVLGNFAVAPAGAQQAADASSQAPQQFQDSSSMLPQPARATPYSSNEVIDAVITSSAASRVGSPPSSKKR